MYVRTRSLSRTQSLLICPAVLTALCQVWSSWLQAPSPTVGAVWQCNCGVWGWLTQDEGDHPLHGCALPHRNLWQRWIHHRQNASGWTSCKGECSCVTAWYSGLFHVLLHLLLCTNSRLLLAGWGAHNVYICTYTYIRTYILVRMCCLCDLAVVILIPAGWPDCRGAVCDWDSHQVCALQQEQEHWDFSFRQVGIQWAFGGHSMLQPRSTPLDLKRLLAA